MGGAAAGRSSALRRALVDELRERRLIRSSAVAAAFLAVGRETFLPELARESGLAAVYADEAIVTRRDAQGRPISSSSQPGMMAQMLELLDVRPGMRVLEIGTGTGYNAAVLAELAGTSGRVASVEVADDLARSARVALRSGGWPVEVVVGDGRHGWAEDGPYDRIVVTACADALPAAWLEQLAEGGRLVVPLRLDADGLAVQIIPAFARRGDRLEMVGFTWGGFMPLHGGDGGWSSPSPSLSASRYSGAIHEQLAAVRGAAVGQLEAERARRLLVELLEGGGEQLASGELELGAGRPPVLMLHLLISIPAARRVSLSGVGRLGVGSLHSEDASLAYVWFPSPWGRAADAEAGAATWTLRAIGDGSARRELEGLIDGWLRRQEAGETNLRMDAVRDGGSLRLEFGWSERAAES